MKQRLLLLGEYLFNWISQQVSAAIVPSFFFIESPWATFTHKNKLYYQQTYC